MLLRYLLVSHLFTANPRRSFCLAGLSIAASEEGEFCSTCLEPYTAGIFLQDLPALIVHRGPSKTLILIQTEPEKSSTQNLVKLADAAGVAK